MNKCGIYAIECIVNNKRYYGSTKNWEQRKYRHILELKANKHANKHLQHSWNKYGKDTFRFLWIIDTPYEKLLEIEQIYLDNNIDSFNINPIAKSPPSRKGIIVSLVTRQKMSLAQKSICNIPPNTLGRRHSDKTKKKMSIVQTGKKLSEDTKKKLHIVNSGKILSKETKQKISKSKIGCKSSPSSFKTGHIVTPEVRKKIAITNSLNSKGYYKVQNKWRVSLTINGNKIHGGYFILETDAKNKIIELREKYNIKRV